MKKRNLGDSNEGAVGVLVAVLLVGLFISMIAFVQQVYVPQWMEQKEAEHMDQVANQFTQLKFAIDTLSISKQPYSPISSPITLGTKEMPFLSSVRTYGSLDIMPTDCVITIENSLKTVTYSLGSLKYSSHNAYYLDQSYVFENGALILSQSLNNIVVVKPAFLVTDSDDLVFTMVKLSDIGNKISASGYGTYPIQTRFSSSRSIDLHYVENITIISSYKDAWETFFNDTLPDSIFDYTIEDTAEGDGLILRFSDETIDFPLIDVSLVDINIQISPGWVE